MKKSGNKAAKVLHTNDVGSSPQNIDRLNQLANNSGNIIFAAHTARPFDLHPDKITICPNRVTITYGKWFNSSEYPLPIENVIGSRITTGIFYATLVIETFGLEKPAPLRFLRKDDARLARRYILALVECSRNKVDLSSYSLAQLRKVLKLIGMVRHDKGDTNSL